MTATAQAYRTPYGPSSWDNAQVSPSAARTAPGMVNNLMRGADVAKSTCSVDECERAYVAKGYCGAHYQKWVRTGDPTTPNRRPPVGPDTCTVSGCERGHYGKELCEMHYARLRRTGTLDAPTTADRFWAKVDASGVCWEWTAGTNGWGYGSFSDPMFGRALGAHRWAYSSLIGPIPDGLHIDHLCRNRACVNPDHMEPVTPGENVRRGARAKPRTVRA